MNDSSTLSYQPALDGVRAVSVIAVLLFHGEFSWMSGGYLGVSVFFTLSGFLITSLLLVEHGAHGSIDLPRFYSRRARRLVPASVLCVVMVCALAAAGWFDGVAGVRGDAIGALGQVFNWVKLAGGDSYADIAAANAGLRKPLEHYWSLAIEEQFYWVWPLAMGLVLRRSERRGGTTVGVLSMTFAVFALAAPLIAQIAGPDAAYWATPARVSEILAGAVVAALHHHGRLTLVPAWLGPASLLAIIVACVLVPSGRGPAYEGFLPLFAVLSAALIGGLQTPGTMVTAFSARPLVSIGKVSYGLYLYHWPVFVLVDRARWNVPDVVEFAAKMAITGLLTVLSYSLIERPIRLARWRPRRTAVASLTAVGMALATVPLVPGVDTFYRPDAERADDVAIDPLPGGPLPTLVAASTPAVSISVSSTTLQPIVDPPASVAGSTTTPPTSQVPLVPPRPVRVLVVGDSTAEALGAGLIEWAAENPDLAQVSLEVAAGCPLTPGGWVVADDERDIRQTCSPWSTEVVPDKVAELHPDVVLFMTSAWDVTARRLVADGPLLDPTIPEYAAVIEDAFSRLTSASLDAGASRVVWVRHPIPDPWWLDVQMPGRDPARHEALYDIMDVLAAGNPAVRVADLVGEMDRRGWLNDQQMRPDGSHFDIASSTMVADEWLGPFLVLAALT